MVEPICPECENYDNGRGSNICLECPKGLFKRVPKLRPGPLSDYTPLHQVVGDDPSSRLTLEETIPGCISNTTLLSALQHMPLRLSAVLVERYVLKVSTRDCGELFHVSHTQVTRWERQALALLEEMLEGTFHEDT